MSRAKLVMETETYVTVELYEAVEKERDLYRRKVWLILSHLTATWGDLDESEVDPEIQVLFDILKDVDPAGGDKPLEGETHG